MSAPPGWHDYVWRWRGQVPPLRPHADCVAAIAAAVAERDARVLLLGATPELAGIGADLTALDRAQWALTDIWPGDTARARAVLGDWRAMPFGDAHFTCAVGDGVLNALPDGARTAIVELDRVIAPGGCIALRAFVAPDDRETPQAIAADVIAGREPSFAATKWRLAMALTGADWNVNVTAVHAAFEALFPDRAVLSHATGWADATIAEIDAYRGSSTRLAFPPRAAFETIVAPVFSVRWIDAGAYPLAGRCPILVLER